MNQISILKLYKTKFRGDDTKTYQIFGVPISNSKMTRKVQFHPEAPLIKYHQNSSNSCFLSILASSFHYYDDDRAVSSLVNCIEESLTLQTKEIRIEFISLMLL